MASPKSPDTNFISRFRLFKLPLAGILNGKNTGTVLPAGTVTEINSVLKPTLVVQS